MRVDTQPSAALLSGLGSPQRTFRAVHVTGSKGKGSVAALVGAGLEASGARVGIYGSPHVERVNERVRIGGEEIGDDEFGDALAAALDVRESGATDATWFDVVTAAAMRAFGRAGVDWGVVEVGLGGRLDSTNVLGAPVVVVTNIALEHADIIGPGLTDVAYEKAGIFSRGCRAVVGMSERDALAGIFVKEGKDVGAAETLFLPKAQGMTLGDHNIALARAALQRALPDADASELLPEERAREVLATLPGRLERFCVEASTVRDVCPRPLPKSFDNLQKLAVDVTLDGAHIADSVARVLEEVRSRDQRPPVVLLALGQEKDAPGICQAVRASEPRAFLVTRVSDSDSYMAEDALAAVAQEAGVEAEAISNADEALLRAIIRAGEEDTHCVVLGSLHLAGRLRPLLRGSHCSS